MPGLELMISLKTSLHVSLASEHASELLDLAPAMK